MMETLTAEQRQAVQDLMMSPTIGLLGMMAKSMPLDCTSLDDIKTGLSIEFHDPTNGTETPAWRQVKIDDPDDGLVTIDLNETILMWFAVTGHATCPAPVEGNTISVPVRAGERL